MIRLSQLSIKTRIETTSSVRCQLPRSGLSQLSIKTRIETFVLPSILVFRRWCLSQLSIKTRIETRPSDISGRKRPWVWVSYPLKQGLKLCVLQKMEVRGIGLSQLSIKTRIETKASPEMVFFLGLSQLSIKTRIETSTFAQTGARE